MARDLTRWNRAGLDRVRYVDGNAAVFLERMRARLAADFPQWPATAAGRRRAENGDGSALSAQPGRPAVAAHARLRPQPATSSPNRSTPSPTKAGSARRRSGRACAGSPPCSTTRRTHRPRRSPNWRWTTSRRRRQTGGRFPGQAHAGNRWQTRDLRDPGRPRRRRGAQRTAAAGLGAQPAAAERRDLGPRRPLRQAADRRTAAARRRAGRPPAGAPGGRRSIAAGRRRRCICRRRFLATMAAARLHPLPPAARPTNCGCASRAPPAPRSAAACVSPAARRAARRRSGGHRPTESKPLYRRIKAIQGEHLVFHEPLGEVDLANSTLMTPITVPIAHLGGNRRPDPADRASPAACRLERAHALRCRRLELAFRSLAGRHPARRQPPARIPAALRMHQRRLFSACR
jgi:hypothetical protein